LDRLFWTVLRATWSRWKDALVIVQPETVVVWHRAGFRLYWRWKSRARGGRPRITEEVRVLIRRLARGSRSRLAEQRHTQPTPDRAKADHRCHADFAATAWAASTIVTCGDKRHRKRCGEQPSFQFSPDAGPAATLRYDVDSADG